MDAQAKIDQLRGWIGDLQTRIDDLIVDKKRAWDEYDYLNKKFKDFKQSIPKPPEPKRTEYSTIGKVINVNFGLKTDAKLKSF